ncbi:unnamed protein product [Prorocentrum cordatum]|uniref:Uncharacterized protein n=1 Tax=Prorocentrum cordatum TaxID=2364126 RepID=A0ABN9SYB3_9DINO|nr:unnamed protein product [Polarella glacialis]
MTIAPWKLFSESTYVPAAQVEEIRGALERALRLSPRHPGANHLLIHLMEMSPTPEQALGACALLLEPYAPDAPHLLHMPSHIYMLLGRYGDAVRSNVAAVRANTKLYTRYGDGNGCQEGGRRRGAVPQGAALAGGRRRRVRAPGGGRPRGAEGSCRPRGRAELRRALGLDGAGAPRPRWAAAGAGPRWRGRGGLPQRHERLRRRRRLGWRSGRGRRAPQQAPGEPVVAAGAGEVPRGGGGARRGRRGRAVDGEKARGGGPARRRGGGRVVRLRALLRRAQARVAARI